MKVALTRNPIFVQDGSNNGESAEYMFALTTARDAATQTWAHNAAPGTFQPILRRHRSSCGAALTSSGVSAAACDAMWSSKRASSRHPAVPNAFPTDFDVRQYPSGANVPCFHVQACVRRHADALLKSSMFKNIWPLVMLMNCVGISSLQWRACVSYTQSPRSGNRRHASRRALRGTIASRRCRPGRPRGQVGGEGVRIWP